MTRHPTPGLHENFAEEAAMSTDKAMVTDAAVRNALAEFRKFVELIEGRAMACDGPVTPFLEQLHVASDAEKERFTAILRSLYAAPETASFRVKPLEWSEEEGGEFIAQSPVGWFHIGMPASSWNLTTPQGEVLSHGSLEAAKAAAFADYERRILSALAHPPAKREAGENVDASILRERVSRAIFDPGQTEGYKGERTLTDWQTDAVMRVLGYPTTEGSDNG